MDTLLKHPDLLPRLQQFGVFHGLDPAALTWLIERSEYVCYDPGVQLFHPAQIVDHMQVIVEGNYVMEIEQQGETRELGVWGAGHITGVLPFSRMTEARATGRALERCCVLELHKRYFTEMVNTSYELTQALVSVMTTRVREFASQRFQMEKLLALGKLSAGLAHELNNPAAAMVRDAQVLYRKVHHTPEKFKAVITMRITPEQTDQVNAILHEHLRSLNRLDLSTMERLDCLETLQNWLDDRSVGDADELAETFVEFGVTTHDLDRFEEILEGKHLDPVLHWVESTLCLEKLVCDIQESADRIKTLVQSVKAYSNMDRAVAMEPVDVHDGLRNTLIMLQHSLRKKNIQLDKQLDKALPKIPAYPGELNQIWTNLIGNAVDAMSDGGILAIRTFRERQSLCVTITDSGTGIPEENLTRIFDPFFTTKPMGEGTGMGLDIVKRIVDRHRGEISVTSRPGETVFKVCLPIKENS